MSKSIVPFDEQTVKDELRELVGKTIKETINAMLDEEADRLVGARPYERTDGRTAYSAKKALISRSLSPDAIRYSSSFSQVECNFLLRQKIIAAPHLCEPTKTRRHHGAIMPAVDDASRTRRRTPGVPDAVR